jgi:hypothetical protein
MRLTIIKDDGVVGIDGVFKTIDLSSLSPGIRVVQWDGTSGHLEFYSDVSPNLPINSIDAYQVYVDAWNLLPELPNLPEPPKEELIAAAHARINANYEAAVNQMTAGYPQTEIASWPKQEREARAWVADNTVPTPWIDAAAEERGITKVDLVTKIVENADALAPLHGALTGKRQKLRDQIDALGPNPTEAQLGAIQW